MRAEESRKANQQVCLLNSYNAQSPTHPYSALSVLDGSTRAAHHGGTQQAITDTPTSNAITLRYVFGSCRDVPVVFYLISTCPAITSKSFKER